MSPGLEVGLLVGLFVAELVGLPEAEPEPVLQEEEGVALVHSVGSRMLASTRLNAIQPLIVTGCVVASSTSLEADLCASRVSLRWGANVSGSRNFMSVDLNRVKESLRRIKNSSCKRSNSTLMSDGMWTMREKLGSLCRVLGEMEGEGGREESREDGGRNSHRCSGKSSTKVLVCRVAL
jgi:hypothetical protein